jgi:hypothetical protein
MQKPQLRKKIVIGPSKQHIETIRARAHSTLAEELFKSDEIPTTAIDLKHSMTTEQSRNQMRSRMVQT